MPGWDTWITVTLNLPLWGAALLVLITLGLGGYEIYRYRQGRGWFARKNPDPQSIEVQTADQQEAYLQFLYNLSHEVSNPLQSMLTNLDNMASCTPEEAGRWRQYHALISAEARRLAALTDNLRLLSRLETPGMPVQREPVNIKGVIEGVMMAQVEAAEARGVRLSYLGPERPARVLGDRDHLYRAMMNLVDNAIKYSHEDGGKVVISVSDEGERLCVRVADDGIGISVEDLPHVFETAYRAREAASFRRAGSGLGLAIVRRIVEQHGGVIHVESRPGEGATFTFDLPIFHPT